MEGAGSSASITRSTVENIRVSTVGQDWVAYQATNGATLTVSDTTLRNNAGARSLFSGIGGSEVNIVRVDAISNEGAQALVSDLVRTNPIRLFYSSLILLIFSCSTQSNQIVSGIVEANTGTTINIQDSDITGATDFFVSMITRSQRLSPSDQLTHICFQYR